MRQLNEEIENLRKTLVEYVLSKGSQNPDTLAVSQLLDIKINESMQLKKRKVLSGSSLQYKKSIPFVNKKRLNISEWILC